MAISSVNIDLILTMSEGGMSVQEMAEELDTTPDTIYSAIRRVYPGLLGRIKDERDEQMAAMYDEQDPPESGNYVHTVGAVLAAFGGSTQTMYNALDRTNTPRRRETRDDTRARDAAVVKDYEEGWAVVDVCIRNRVSLGKMYQILHAKGVQLRRAAWESRPPLKTLRLDEEGRAAIIALSRPIDPATPNND